MRIFIFTACTALMVSACINTVQPVSTETLPTAQNEPVGMTNSEQQGTAFTISTEAFYQATIHSTTSPGRVISLSLMPNNRAEMTTNYLDSSSPELDTGKWTTLTNGNLNLNMRRFSNKDSINLEFKTDGEKLVYTGSEYGTGGLILYVKPVPTAK